MQKMHDERREEEREALGEGVGEEGRDGGDAYLRSEEMLARVDEGGEENVGRT